MQVAAALSSRRLLWGSWRTLVCAEGLQWRGLAAAAVRGALPDALARCAPKRALTRLLPAPPQDTNAAAAEVKAEGAAPAAKIHAACVLERLPVSGGECPPLLLLPSLLRALQSLPILSLCDFNLCSSSPGRAAAPLPPLGRRRRCARCCCAGGPAAAARLVQRVPGAMAVGPHQS